MVEKLLCHLCGTVKTIYIVLLWAFLNLFSAWCFACFTHNIVFLSSSLIFGMKLCGMNVQCFFFLILWLSQLKHRSDKLTRAFFFVQLNLLKFYCCFFLVGLIGDHLTLENIWKENNIKSLKDFHKSLQTDGFIIGPFADWILHSTVTLFNLKVKTHLLCPIFHANMTLINACLFYFIYLLNLIHEWMNTVSRSWEIRPRITFSAFKGRVSNSSWQLTQNDALCGHIQKI